MNVFEHKMTKICNQIYTECKYLSGIGSKSNVNAYIMVSV